MILLPIVTILIEDKNNDEDSVKKKKDAGNLLKISIMIKF
jgi:hypothetical protein